MGIKKYVSAFIFLLLLPVNALRGNRLPVDSRPGGRVFNRRNARNPLLFDNGLFYNFVGVRSSLTF
ncbi:hypothetical protein BMS3Abin10_00313 [bacterium BMS3Abin10]|nr:hypothetical protein BMS3Abin10_00313 [bacterium BMS3Abin10]GBE39472.1 hypothetical protein BMS3Bbin08_02095 [bacterium BMS3Bbin08]